MLSDKINMLDTSQTTILLGETTPWAVYSVQCGNDRITACHGYDFSLSAPNGLCIWDKNKEVNEDIIIKLFSDTKIITKGAMMILENKGILENTDPLKKHMPVFDLNGASNEKFWVIRPLEHGYQPGSFVPIDISDYDGAIDLSDQSDITSFFDTCGNTHDTYKIQSDVGSNHYLYFKLEEAFRDITLSHLATHSSGLHNYTRLGHGVETTPLPFFNFKPMFEYSFYTNDRKTIANSIQRLAQKQQRKSISGEDFLWGAPGWTEAFINNLVSTRLLTQQPGEQFAYSTDMEILGEVILHAYRKGITDGHINRKMHQHVAINSLDQQHMLDDLIFNELGMIDTFYYRDLSHGRFQDTFDRWGRAVLYLKERPWSTPPFNYTTGLDVSSDGFDASSNSNLYHGWLRTNDISAGLGPGKFGGYDYNYKKLSAQINGISDFVNSDLNTEDPTKGINLYTTFMDVSGYYVSSGGGLMSTPKEMTTYLRFLMTGLDKNGNVLVPKPLLNRYTKESIQIWSPRENSLGTARGFYALDYKYTSSTLMGRILPGGLAISDFDGNEGGQLMFPQPPTSGSDVPDALFHRQHMSYMKGALGTNWILDFTNESVHYSVIQVLPPSPANPDTPYKKTTNSGYKQNFIQNGKSLSAHQMTGDGDFVTNNVAFERSVADRFYNLQENFNKLLIDLSNGIDISTKVDQLKL